MIAAAILAALLAAAAPPRTPDQRQVLVDLAYVLGESHALRAACRGAEDQVWRERMSRLLEVEAPDDSTFPLRARAHGFYWTEGVRGLGWAVDAVPTVVRHPDGAVGVLVAPGFGNRGSRGMMAAIETRLCSRT